MDDILYKEYILDIYRHPLNKKVLADFDAEAREFNPLCGDDITVQIKFDREGRAADIGYQIMGCAISQAAASLITEEVKGKDKAVIAHMGLKNITDLLGMEIIPIRVQCALLGLKAIQFAIGDRRWK